MAVAGRLASFKIDNSSDVLTDISSKCDSINHPNQIGNATTTTFGDTAEEYIVTVSDATFSISGPWDSTIDTHITGILTRNENDWEYGPEGTSSGKRKYTGKCVVSSFDVQGSYQGATQFSLQLQCSGKIARSTFT